LSIDQSTIDCSIRDHLRHPWTNAFLSVSFVSFVVKSAFPILLSRQNLRRGRRVVVVQNTQICA
jgi:hypothetical protein